MSSLITTPSPPSGSALSRVPPELLTEIFFSSVQDVFVNPDCNDTPLNLAATCRQWRAVALSTPNLWAQFHLSVAPEGKTDKQLTNLLPFLNMWLERSQSVPLSCILSYIGDNEDSDRGIDTVFYPLIETLVGHSQRWVDVEIYTPDPRSHSLLYINLAYLYLPLLKRLSIPGWFGYNIGIALTSANAPHSTSVAFPVLILGSSSWTLPWSQLTKLNIIDTDLVPAYIEQVIDVLSHVPHLRELHIEAHFEDFFPKDTAPARITLPFLTHLRLAINIEIVLDLLLAAIDTPALTSLSLYGCSYATISPSLARFIQNHRECAPSKIETLELGRDVPPHDMVQHISFWRNLGSGPGLKCVGLHLNEGSIMTIHSLYEWCKTMWELGDRTGPILEEVVLSFGMRYAFSCPDTIIAAIQYLKILVNRLSEDGSVGDVGFSVVDGRLGEPFFPCARMKRIRIRMIESDGAPVGLARRNLHLVLRRAIKTALSNLVERGIEMSIERAQKGCMFA